MASDPYSQIINGALGTAGTIVETIGLQKQFKAQAKAARLGAVLALEQASVDADRSRRSAARRIGSQRGQVARSGISIEGSQGDLLNKNEFELELDAIFIERFGDELARQGFAKEKALKKASKKAKVAGIIKSFQSS